MQMASSASSDVIAWNYAEPIWISQKYFKLSGITRNLPGLAGITWNKPESVPEVHGAYLD